MITLGESGFWAVLQSFPLEKFYQTGVSSRVSAAVDSWVASSPQSSSRVSFLQDKMLPWKKGLCRITWQLTSLSFLFFSSFFCRASSRKQWKEVSDCGFWYNQIWNVCLFKYFFRSYCNMFSPVPRLRVQERSKKLSSNHAREL